MTIRRPFFVLIRYQILILTYDQTCLLLLMWNNGTRKFIHDNYMLIYCPDKLPDCNLEL